MHGSSPNRGIPGLRFLYLAVLLGSVSMIGCASGAVNGGGDTRVDPGDFSTAERLSTWTPPTGQTCAIASEGNPLPSVAEITDSTALARAIAQRWSELDSGRGSALFSIRFDSVGAVERNLILESTLESAPQLTLFELVSNHLHAPPANRERSLHLRVDAGVEPKFEVGWSTQCYPELLNSAEIQSLIKRIAESLNLTGLVVLELRLDTRGGVSQSEIAESSGNAVLDRYAVQVGYRMKFYPALLDRIPVGVTVRLPVRIAN